MDDDKDDKSLFQKAIETVKEVASSVTEAVTSASPSQRVESAPPEENFDAPDMTADELTHHAATDTQPVLAAKAPRKKAASPSLSGRITPTYDIPVPDTPMPSPKKRKAAVKTKSAPKRSPKKSSKKSAKKSAKESAKKAVKKVTKNTAKKTAKKKKTLSRIVRRKKKAKRG